MSENLLFVYGTLMKGEGNWRSYLAPLLGVRAVLSGAILKNLGGFPGLVFVKDKTKQVFGEVYSITDKALKKIDGLEGYRGEGEDNMYEREEITLDDGTKALVYVWNRGGGSPVIKSGNWRKR